MKKLTESPVLLFVYLLVAAAIIANIFISGYWFGRTRQVLESEMTRGVAAVAAPEQ